ncbi:RNA-directed DNA polymerase, eukaryota, partial [Tanacetum coccineum]
KSGALDNSSSYSRRSHWLDIVNDVRKLASKGIDLLSLVKKKVGNGEATSFWKDVWLGDFPLKQTWSWLLDPSGDFSVKSIREFIDDSMLPKMDVPTRWVKSIPIKINIFAWRVSLDKLPTRLNLSLRGLDIPSIICPLCSIAVESTSHLLFSCQLARQLMIKVVHWWELEYQDFHSYEDWLLWFKNLRVSKRLKDVFEGVCYISLWVIWKFRNQVLFGINFPRLDLLFDDIVRLSFHWCSSRFEPIVVDPLDDDLMLRDDGSGTTVDACQTWWYCHVFKRDGKDRYPNLPFKAKISLGYQKWLATVVGEQAQWLGEHSIDVIESYKWYQILGSFYSVWATRFSTTKVLGVELNIEKLDGNIVQKYGGSKQVGFKQLGPGIETGVHGVHDEKRVWFEVELHGAQGDCDVEVFQVSNDDTAVAQRRLEDKQPEEKTTQTAWNMGLNESEKTFIGSGVGTGSMQVLHGFEFKRATLSVETIQYREDSNEAAFTVATVEKIYAHESLTFNNTLACEVISKCKARLKDDMDARSDVYVLSNGCKKCSDNSDGYYWESTPAGYMKFTEAWKKEIWLKGHLTKSGYELSLVARIATGALVKGGSRSKVPAQMTTGELVNVDMSGHKFFRHDGDKNLRVKDIHRVVSKMERDLIMVHIAGPATGDAILSNFKTEGGLQDYNQTKHAGE